jgi:hypothetical protein
MEKKVMDQILAECVGLVLDATMSVLHRIGRKIDAHDHLWVPFARHLGLPERFISQMFLMEDGGGSPGKWFVNTLFQQRPQTLIRDFQGAMLNCGMDDVAELLDEEDGGAFLDSIHWEAGESVEEQLNLPKESPRWRELSKRYGSIVDEKEMDYMCRRPNRYHPSIYILITYRQMHPGDNFDKIREFLVREQKILFHV